MIGQCCQSLHFDFYLTTDIKIITKLNFKNKVYVKKSNK